MNLNSNNANNNKYFISHYVSPKSTKEKKIPKKKNLEHSAKKINRKKELNSNRSNTNTNRPNNFEYLQKKNNINYNIPTKVF